MGLETGTYPTFVGGASQQDDTVRSPNQLTDAINAWLHAAMGDGKRPPAVFVSVLASNLDPMSHFHSINRDSVERYIVAVGHRSIRVFDHETGKEYVVSKSAGSLDYLDTHGLQPWSVFKTTTVADVTFVVNRNTSPAMSTVKDTGHIAGYAQTLQDLPKSSSPYPSAGSIFKITGTTDSPFDDYYARRTSASVWEECADPTGFNTLDAATMPHILKRIPDGTNPDGFYFAFGPAEWATRQAGDTSSNPPPSFVGDRIQEVFLHGNRLGFLTTESFVLSEIGRYYNLWRTTVTQLLDSDPIDSTIASNGVVTLRHAVPFESALYLAGEGSQYQVTSEPYLSPKNVRAKPVNSYSSSPYIRPQLMGDSLYFVDDLGEFATVREYFMDDQTITGDAAEVTSHVPRYIPGRVRSMATATNADCVLFAKDTEGGSQLYVYFVRWAGQDKQQSAWARWEVSGVGKVVHLHTLGGSTYAVAEAPGGGCELLRFDLMLNQSDSDATADYTFMLDRQVVLTPYYHDFGNYTEIALPYVLSSLSDFVAIKTDDWADPGAYLDLTGASLTNGGTVVRLAGRHDTGRVAVGLEYEHRTVLTRPMLRDNQGNAIIVARNQVRDITVAYKDAAYFEVMVESKGAGRTETFLASQSGTYNARVLNDSTFRLSAPSFHSGSRRFPVLSNADSVRITLVNRLPYQCWFLSAQWRGVVVSRSRV